MPEWMPAGLWVGGFVGALLAVASWWFRRRGRALAIALADLQRNHEALSEMLQAGWQEREEANRKAEVLQIEVDELSDRNDSLENQLRWLRGQTQEDRDTFICALRRWVEAVNEGI